MPDYEDSLGDQNTFNNEGQNDEDTGPESLGDEMTFAGGPGLGEPQSLGDEATFGGDTGSVGDAFDDDMEVVDLAARYTTEGMLGKGGMGEVLLATDTRLNRKVAIKRILGSAARSKTAVSRFLTEAQSIAALNHPNIVQIYDYGRAKDGPFLIMEFVEGSSLLDKCREGAIPLEEAIDLTCQLCDGLSKAHAANIVHRDIKPANVLLTEDGVPKLTDFGLAKDEAADTGMTMAGAVIGTLDFMPPEQRKDAALTDNRSDLWSLAATLYQMVTGKSPKIIKFNDVPKTLQDVLGKALEDSKADRYQNALEFKEALQQSLQGGADAYAELDQGECPHCGTKNDASRKFCRNADCGGSLEVTCLACSENIPMWEAVCGSCGSKQADLLDARREQMVEQRREAEGLLVGQDYTRAIRLAGELASESDLRLQHLKKWADNFVDDVEQQKQRELSHVQELFVEALKHEEAFDDAAGIKTLLQVAEPLRDESLSGRDDNVTDLLHRLNKRQTKAGDLEKQIQLQVKSRQLGKVPVLVDELLEIRPHRADVKKLRQQLTDRSEKLQRVRDESYERAMSMFEQQDYLRCLNALKKVDVSLVDKGIEELRQQAEATNKRVGELDAEIRKSMSAKQFDGLLEIVEEYLFLQREDTERQQLRDQLVARGEKQLQQVASLVEKAKRLRNQCDFDAALQTLNTVPQSQLVGEAERLSHECTDLQYQRSQAFPAVQRAMADQSFATALQTASGYHVALQQKPHLKDNGFAQLYQQCQAKLREQQQRARNAERAKAATKKIAIFGGIAAAVVVLLIVGAIGYTTWQAGKLADAISGQRWGEVLKLDPDNVPALVGQAKQQLVGYQPNLKAIAADLARAEQLDPAYGELGSAKAQLYAAEAIQAAELGDLAEAESKLRKAEDLNIDASTGDRAKKSLASAYVERSESALKSGKLTLAISEGQKAISYDPDIDLPDAVREAAQEAAREKAAAAAAADLSQSVNAYVGQPSDAARDAVLAALTELERLDSDSTSLTSAKTRLVPILVSRCQNSLSQRSYAGFAGDYGLLSRLDSAEVGRFAASLSNLPPSVLSNLPPSVLSNLPPSVLSNLPPITNSIGMGLKVIPTGTFTMGDDNDAPEVTLSKSFSLGIHEVTQSQYERVMGKNPSRFKGANNPVEQVSWEDAVEFCRKLSELPAEKAAGRVYRLPTEAEWEYACRAGTTTKYSFGDDDSEIGNYAWFDGNSGNSGDTSHPVGGKQPNAWGLYDMHGNVWEWCQDWYGDYPSGTVTDPTGATSGSNRVGRGGRWPGTAEDCRSAYRVSYDPRFRSRLGGFRVCLSLSGQ
ncbi:SUMF1/EgtB/PvdO family nonheme iron enzyme [Rubripirellula sp.]|nr:SUMF1/EgtB/PvdO family nonheme iron enzyme [Rubripirellula sp.]MDB4644462.1 SUMF1/EgtB/PvdO family nonheme iron enzyme [Rubripirellula sp.]